MGSELHSFSPSVRGKSESVPPTHFSHCNKMEKKSVPPTLFFPIIEGEKVQRVRNFTEPRYTLSLADGHMESDSIHSTLGLTMLLQTITNELVIHVKFASMWRFAQIPQITHQGELHDHHNISLGC